ncbi:hypothetical protein AYJ08_00850 [Brevibacillus sp. SKDU10]|uniref:GNAT family N-acetyltransferase n=1 Tax=Brevibacillus sp. SKDU10 TaxID=1247872 RepID=UPI0007C989CC|nr:GNAT family protein [Brevibacillus sp. SKDU10]OAJ73351.1 hypothetical protein AYJ08_00850 [Brevibacillus sp. SKDU10]
MNNENCWGKIIIIFGIKQRFGLYLQDRMRSELMCNSQNKRSIALMERIGMTKEAVFKEELFWQNEWVDQYFFSVLEKEFLQIKG